MRDRALGAFLVVLVILVLLTWASWADAQTVYLPEVQAADCRPAPEPTGIQWAGFLELAEHCVVWGEILDCVEFPAAAQLNDQDCFRMQSLALVVCDVMWSGGPAR